MSALPYCSYAGCHDTRTNTYAVQVDAMTGSNSVTTSAYTEANARSTTRTILVNYPWGIRYCRIHALLANRFAFGGAA